MASLLPAVKCPDRTGCLPGSEDPGLRCGPLAQLYRSIAASLRQSPSASRELRMPAAQASRREAHRHRRDGHRAAGRGRGTGDGSCHVMLAPDPIRTSIPPRSPGSLRQQQAGTGLRVRGQCHDLGNAGPTDHHGHDRAHRTPPAAVLAYGDDRGRPRRVRSGNVHGVIPIPSPTSF
jgi:hypothetical protein